MFDVAADADVGRDNAPGDCDENDKLARHDPTPGRPPLGQECVISLLCSELRTNWIASNKLSNAVNIVNIHTRVKPTLPLSMAHSLLRNI